MDDLRKFNDMIEAKGGFLVLYRNRFYLGVYNDFGALCILNNKNKITDITNKKHKILK